MFLIGLGILLLASFIGSRLQGISLSMLGAAGVLLLLVLFNTTPAVPPFQVILCIASVVVAVGVIEAAGGLTYLVQLAESLIRRHPHRITYLSPLVTYLLTFLAGTNHITYSILPVIAQVAKDVGIRPERPLSLSVIAALHGTLASPVSATMVILGEFLTPSGIEMGTVFKILIPSTIGGLLIATLVVGQLSAKIPAIGGMDCATPVAAVKGIDTLPPVARVAKVSVLCFCLGSLSIVLLDVIKCLRPSWEVNGVLEYLPSGFILPLVMLSSAALIMLFCRISPEVVTQGKAFTAGIQGMFSLLGIAWLSSTFVEGNQAMLLEGMANHLAEPWQFAIILLLMSAIMGSSAATVKAIFPLGIALGIAPKVLLASAAAVNGVFIIPIYPTILSAMNLDTTGTTRIGKYFFNHSFMLPGLITIFGAVGIAFLLIHFFF